MIFEILALWAVSSIVPNTALPTATPATVDPKITPLHLVESHLGNDEMKANIDGFVVVIRTGNGTFAVAKVPFLIVFTTGHPELHLILTNPVS